MRAIPCFEARDGETFHGDDARERCLDHEAAMDDQDQIERFMVLPTSSCERMDGISARQSLRRFLAFQRREAQDKLTHISEAVAFHRAMSNTADLAASMRAGLRPESGWDGIK